LVIIIIIIIFLICGKEGKMLNGSFGGRHPKFWKALFSATKEEKKSRRFDQVSQPRRECEGFGTSERQRG